MEAEIQKICHYRLSSFQLPSYPLSNHKPSRAHKASTFPPLHLPSTPLIRPQLLAAGCSLSDCRAFSENFTSATIELRKVCELDYEKTCRGVEGLCSKEDELQKITETIRQASQKRFTKYVKLWQERLVEVARTRLQRTSSSAQAPSNCERSAFKREWTPFLMSCFLQNPYPSPKVRAVLACKTGMTTKQIYDWQFQNHRTRGGTTKEKRSSSNELSSSNFTNETSSILDDCDSATVSDEQVRSTSPPVSKKRRTHDDDFTPTTFCYTRPTRSPISFNFFCLPENSFWPCPLVPIDKETFWSYPTGRVYGCEPAVFNMSRQFDACSRPQKRKRMDPDMVDQLADTFANKRLLRGMATQPDSCEIAHDTHDKFKPWWYHYTHLPRHPSTLLPGTNQYKESKYKLRLCKPLPKRQSQRISLSRSGCSFTSVGSTFTFSSSATSPLASIDETSVSMTRIRKGFEAYADPPVRLNSLFAD